jgi:hypothetical protein
MGIFGNKSNGKNRATVGKNGSRFATPASKIKKERADNAARAAESERLKRAKGKNW